MDFPIFINCRDRVSCLAEQVSWLERAGHEDITFLDNDSTYEPLLAYYEASPHRLIRLGENLGSRALWKRELQPKTKFYVYTDPDVVPIASCPLDAVEHFWDLLWVHEVPKVGFGFDLSKLPEDLPVIWQETEYRSNAPRVEGARVAPLDTTFALYRPGGEFTFDALRSEPPYLARHVPWDHYHEEPDAEEAHYLSRCLVGGLEGSTTAAWKLLPEPFLAHPRIPDRTT